MIWFRRTFALTTILATLLALPALAAPLTFSVDGVITKSGGTPLEEPSVTFYVDIVSPAAAGNCLLYREQFSVDMTGSNGYFVIPVGKGSNSAPGSYTLDTVFSSGTTMSGLQNCASYTPSVNDGRQIIVNFTDTSGPHAFAAQTIEAVPFAMMAKNSDTVGGYSQAQLLKVDPSVTQNANLIQGQYDEFWKLINGTSISYVTPNTTVNGDISGTIGANISVNKLRGYPLAAVAPTSGQVLTYSGTAWTPVTPAPAGVASITANSPLSVSGTATVSLSISQADGTHDGYLTQSDWNTFKNKQSSTLGDAKIWIGNSGNGAAAVAMSGDATLSNTGALTLSSVVTAGTYNKVTVDAKGRVTVGANLAASDIITILGYTPVNKGGDVMSGTFSLQSLAADPAGLTAADKGRMWFRSDLNMVRFWDGTTAASLNGGGSGISTFNGETGASQTLAIDTSGTAAPSWSSASNVHTLNIPLAATAGANAGLITNAQYVALTGKMGNALPSGNIWVGNASGGAAPILMSGDATMSNSGVLAIGTGAITSAKILDGTINGADMDFSGAVNVNAGMVLKDSSTGKFNNFFCSTAGHVPTWQVTGWTCAAPPVYSPSLANGNIWIGNSSGGPSSVSTSGDVSLTNAGAFKVTAIQNIPVNSAAPTNGQFMKYNGANWIGTVLSSSDVTTALGYTPVNKAGDTMSGDLTVNGNITMGANKYFTLSSNATNGTVAGQMWYNSGSILYYDGATVKTLSAGGGISNLNGSTQGSQSFANGFTGNTPGWSTNAGTGVHTLNIPLASASGSVTSGTISNTDWNTFNNKLGTSLTDAQIWIGSSGNVATPVYTSGDATISNAGVITVAKTQTAAASKILQLTSASVAVTKGVDVGGASTGTVQLRYPSTATNTVFTFPSTAGLSNQFLQTDGSGGLTWAAPAAVLPPLASANIWVGNSSGGPAAVSMTGDAGISNTGSLTLVTTGVGAGTYSKVTVDTKGRVTAGANLASADIISSLGYTPVNRYGDQMLGTLDMNNNDMNNAGNISMAANKYFKLSSNSTNGTVTGQMWYNAGTINYYDGSAVRTLSTGALPPLASANIWVGNSSGGPSAVSASGDVNLTNAGAFKVTAIQNIPVNSAAPTNGQFMKYNGANWIGTVLSSSDVTTALGYTPVNRAGDQMLGPFGLQSVTSDPAGLTTSDKGKMWYRSDMSAIRFWDGSTATSLSSGGGGITSLNGLSSSVQTFVIGTSGTDFNLAFSGSTHTFNLPDASTSNRGALKAADWNTFNNKLGTTLNDSKIWVGSSGNAATAVSMSGDATISNTGALVANKTTTGQSNKLLSLDGSGLATSYGNIINGPTSGSVSLAMPTGAGNSNYSLTFPSGQGSGGQILVNTGSGVLAWSTPLTNGTAYVNGGNTFGGNATIGLNDAYTLGFKTNGATQMTLMSTGKLGIGTTTPAELLDVAGNVKVAAGTQSAPAIVLNNAGTGIYSPATDTIAFTSAGSERIRISSVGNLGIGTTNPTYAIDMGSRSDAMRLPQGTTAQQPTSAVGLLRYNTSNSALEYNTGSSWITVANTGTSLSNVLPNGYMWVGNSSGGPAAVSMSGDAGISNSGVVTLASSGVTAGTYTKVGVDSKGRVINGLSLSSTDISNAAGFVNNGNNFGGTATLGTNDNYGLNIETNGATRLAIDNLGNITTSSAFTSNGSFSLTGGATMSVSGNITASSNVNISGAMTANKPSTIGSSATAVEMLDVYGGATIGMSPATETTLSSGITTGSTTFNVASTTGYPAAGTLVMGTEAITYTGITGTTFTGLTRGAFGTTAASQVSGQPVSNYLMSVRKSPTSAPKMVVLDTGSVGIGNVTPAYTLDVLGNVSTGTVARFTNNGSAPVATFGNAQISPTVSATFVSGSTAAAFLGGNVGIGMSNPSFLLDVGSPTNTTTVANFASNIGLGSSTAVFINYNSGGQAATFQNQATGATTFLGLGNNAAQFNGNIKSGGTALVVGNITCGTSTQAITGNNTRGTVTVGSGTSTCQINFVSGGYSSPPVCVISAVGGAYTGYINTTAAGYLLISGVSSGQKYSYICME